MRQKNQHEKTISEFNQLKKSYDDLFDLSKDLEKEADEELELEFESELRFGLPDHQTSRGLETVASP